MWTRISALAPRSSAFLTTSRGWIAASSIDPSAAPLWYRPVLRAAIVDQATGLGAFARVGGDEIAFGKNADGSTRTYSQYVADRTAAMQRLFGTSKPATA